MILSKKNQKLLVSLVIILLWTLFVPKDIGQKKPNEVQNTPTEITSDSAELAKGKSVSEAVHLAKDFIHQAISTPIDVGHGHGPVNHWAYREEA